MAIVSLAPTSIEQRAWMTGALALVQDDPDAPDADWWDCTWSSGDSSPLARLGMAQPPVALVAGAGLQEFRVLGRVDSPENGSAITWNMFLYESGVVLNGGAAIASGTLTGTLGQIMSGTWNASLLTSLDGVGVQVHVVFGGQSGGSPGGRNSGEIGAVKWLATVEDVDVDISGVDSPRASIVSVGGMNSSGLLGYKSAYDYWLFLESTVGNPLTMTLRHVWDFTISNKCLVTGSKFSSSVGTVKFDVPFNPGAGVCRRSIALDNSYLVFPNAAWNLDMTTMWGVDIVYATDRTAFDTYPMFGKSNGSLGIEFSHWITGLHPYSGVSFTRRWVGSNQTLDGRDQAPSAIGGGEKNSFHLYNMGGTDYLEWHDRGGATTFFVSGGPLFQDVTSPADLTLGVTRTGVSPTWKGRIAFLCFYNFTNNTAMRGARSRFTTVGLFDNPLYGRTNPKPNALF